jgi:hypothetical protein
MADHEPPTTRRDPHFLSRPDPVETGTVSVYLAPESPPLRRDRHLRHRQHAAREPGKLDLGRR